MSKKSGSSLPLSDRTIASIRPAKCLQYHEGASVTSLDFDNSGQFLILAGVDRSIQLYDCHKGVRHKDIQSQKYGAHLARFTHTDLNCLYALTPPVLGDDADHSVRYLLLLLKSYLRYFKGHKDQVTQLEVNPLTDTFLTSSLDHTVKHWDLRTPTCVGSIGVGQNSVVAFDPQGIVFAVGKDGNGRGGGEANGNGKEAESQDNSSQAHELSQANGSSQLNGSTQGSGLNGSLQLNGSSQSHVSSQSHQGKVSFYDVGAPERGPFLTLKIAGVPGEKYTKLEFSNNGKYLLIGTDSSQHYLLDAILGKLIAKLVLTQEYHRGWLDFQYASAGSVCFSPCGKFVIAGSPHGTLAIFDLSKLDGPRLLPFKVIDGKQGITKVLAFDPKLYTLATADDRVVLWTPTVETE